MLWKINCREVSSSDRGSPAPQAYPDTPRFLMLSHLTAVTQ
jgi:hypothetical protein